jgi:lipopolysaccharide transport system ATP-binding protein
MEPAIVIENLSKQYKRGTAGASYTALRDVLMQPFKKSKQTSNDNFFWALNNVNLKIAQGERIGIIGRNGAGKSTLLKIISRITPPTNGRVIIEGRVASLLEVGTGFHPELTGKENIYLNGSILGLKKNEITTKLDEIIDFSGVENFIDTPLKHYSSGMQLRLAFSVAAHLEPEVLLIDEVLAVGDMEFQRKCLGKMEEVSKKSGRTILFVSHNLEAIHKFCERTILLDKGEIVKDDATKAVISYYVSRESNNDAAISWNDDTAPGDEKIKLRNVYVHDKAGSAKPSFFVTEQIGISFQYEVLGEGLSFTHGLNIYNEQGLNVFDSHDNYTEIRKEKRMKGSYTATVWIPPNLLPDGYFSVGVALFSQQPFHIFIHQLHVISFTVMDEISNESARGDYAGSYGGLVRPKLQWQAEKLSDQ